MKNKIACPCCGFLTHDAKKGGGVVNDVCPVCFWCYEVCEEENLNKVSKKNNLTLQKAKDSFYRYGAAHEECLDLVRKPLPSEILETMIDLLPVLLRAQKLEKEKYLIKLGEVFGQGKGDITDSIFFDWEAGDEEWISLLNSKGRIAIVCAKMPLIFVSQDHQEILCKLFEDIAILSEVVESWDEKKYFLDVKRYEAEILDLPKARITNVNLNCLSINDFWWMTI